MLLGVIAGALLLEAALRPISAEHNWREDASVYADSDAGPVHEVRNYHEGIAVSHFSRAYARLTGNPPLEDAQNGVILGDSYVEAVQVFDTETMGAVVERAARLSGTRLNVRQYGWSGASVTRYVGIAPEVLARWKPSWVAVVLNRGDSMLEGRESRCSTEGYDFLAAIHLSTQRPQPPLRRMVDVSTRAVMRHSRLAAEVVHRVGQLSGPRSPDVSQAMAPCALVGALHSVYGSRLVIVYVASVGPGNTDPTDEPVEAAILRACDTQGVACLSTRGGMLSGAITFDRFARGFSNTTPNVGHPNALGHRLIGEELWQILDRRTPRRTEGAQ